MTYFEDLNSIRKKSWNLKVMSNYLNHLVIMFFDQTMVCIKLCLLVKFNKLNKTAFLTKVHTKKLMQ